MSDTETQVVEAAPAAETPPVTDSTPAPEADLFESGADSFPRDYVEKIRHEAADYRTKYAPYRDTFDGATPEQQAYLLDVNRMILTDPAAAAKELRELASVLGGDPEDVQEAVENFAESQTPAEDQPLTLAEWKKIQEQEKAQAAREAEVQGIIKQAADLGYRTDGEDEFGDTAQLLYISAHKTGGDLAAAHALRLERFEQAVNAEVDKRIEEIRSGNRKWAPVAPSGGAAPAEHDEGPKTWADARKRALSRIDRANQVGN